MHSAVVNASRSGWPGLYCCTQSLLGLGLARMSPNMAETKGCGPVATVWGVHSAVVDASGRGWTGLYCCTQPLLNHNSTLCLDPHSSFCFSERFAWKKNHHFPICSPLLFTGTQGKFVSVSTSASSNMGLSAVHLTGLQISFRVPVLWLFGGYYSFASF